MKQRILILSAALLLGITQPTFAQATWGNIIVGPGGGAALLPGTVVNGSAVGDKALAVWSGTSGTNLSQATGISTSGGTNLTASGVLNGLDLRINHGNHSVWIGAGAGSGATLNDTSFGFYGIGEGAGNGLIASGNANDVLLLGDFSGNNMKVLNQANNIHLMGNLSGDGAIFDGTGSAVNTLHIFAIGPSAFANAGVTNCTDFYGFGHGVFGGSWFTNCHRIYAFGQNVLNGFAPYSGHNDETWFGGDNFYWDTPDSVSSGNPYTFRNHGTNEMTLDFQGNLTLWNGTVTVKNHSGPMGEYVTASAASPGTGISSGSATNIVSISLTAGDWDVSGDVAFNPDGNGSISYLACGISQSSATLPTSSSGALTQFAPNSAAGNTQVLPTPSVRVSVSSPGTIYLVAQSGFTSAMNGWGFIRARRIQ